MNRKEFLLQNARIAAGLALTGVTGNLFANPLMNTRDLVVLYTNDWHSHIDPFPMDGGRNQGLGGAAKRAALIKQIRQQYQHVLLLDAGDIFQGTPYFNFFGGELEFKLMSSMGYDAATLGNHDFDSGLEGIVKQLPHAKFPFLCANYDFKGTIMEQKTSEYQIFNKGKYRVGVFGVGIELKGLVPENLYGKTIYNDPISIANSIAHFLRHNKKCNLIICLSHLGYNYDGEKVSDKVLAKTTKEIDIILGGHTHTFLDQPVTVKNANQGDTLISQTGWAGINLGMIVYGSNSRQQSANADFSMLKIC